MSVNYPDDVDFCRCQIDHANEASLETTKAHVLRREVGSAYVYSVLFCQGSAQKVYDEKTASGHSILVKLFPPTMSQGSDRISKHSAHNPVA